MRTGIAIAGTIAVDEIKRVEKYPNKSELTSINSIGRAMGGAVSNCSVTLAKIDPSLPIEAISLVGNDDKGEFLRKKLGEYKNIKLTQLKTIGETPFTDVIMDNDSRTFLYYRGNSHLFNENVIDFNGLDAEILHIAYILLLESLDKEDAKYGTKMAKVLKTAQEYGIKTSIDIVSENSDRYQKIVPPSLKYTNYCIINEIEAGKSVGVNLREANGSLIKENIRTVLKRLKELGVKDWVVIHCPEGSFGMDDENVYSIPSLLLDSKLIKGTVGAGDAYVSGVLYGAIKGLDLPSSMKLGTAAAASSLFEEGSTSGVKSYEELQEMLIQYPTREEILI
ncbi:carbohydrate kinase family protein [Anaerobacillus sp. CMMVII]|nr:carbohydrate kinase family protein [Anaerobacillus sp. CMMVII]